MKPLRDGGPAFPCTGEIPHTVAAAATVGIADVHERDRVYLTVKAQASAGMSLRDYFAAKSMHAMSEAALIDARVRQSLMEQAQKQDLTYIELLAKSAYEMADVMLGERAKGGDL